VVGTRTQLGQAACNTINDCRGVLLHELTELHRRPLDLNWHHWVSIAERLEPPTGPLGVPASHRTRSVNATCRFGRAHPARVLWALSGHFGVIDLMSMIETRAGVRRAKPCFVGTRIAVYHVSAYLASGMTSVEIVDDFAGLTEAHVCVPLSVSQQCGNGAWPRRSGCGWCIDERDPHRAEGPPGRDARFRRD